VATLLGQVKPHLMVTDPPYGVEYDASWRGKAKNADGSLLSTGKDRAKGVVENDDKADWREAWALFPGAVAYVWHGERQIVGTAQELQRAGFALRNLIVWGKSKLVVGRGNYHSQHETCWYAVRKTGTGNWSGDRKQTTLWQIDTPKKSETGHATQKPVECMKRPIENNSSPGQAVYEPFSGSGTTIIAGEMTGRMVHAMEISPAYVDVAATRWAAFTGKVPVLEATGQTWAEVMAERNMDAVPVTKVAKSKAKRRGAAE
jgi:DNA modification methylase